MWHSTVTDEHPDPPDGYDGPEALVRPKWLLEGAGVVTLFVLGWLARSHELLIAADTTVLVGIITGVIALAVIHEGMHVAASLALGHDPVIRLMPPAVYTVDTWGERRDDLVMLATPFVVLNLLGGLIWVLGTGDIALLGLGVIVVNTAVSVADLYVFGYLLAQPPETMTIVVETDDGLTEYVTRPQPE